MERFNEYIIRIHPDPDNLFGKNTEEAWDDICSLAEAYAKELINKNGVLADVSSDKQANVICDCDFKILGKMKDKNGKFFCEKCKGL